MALTFGLAPGNSRAYFSISSIVTRRIPGSYENPRLVDRGFW